MKLRLARVSLREANDYVVEYHRHHKASNGHVFSIGATLDGKLVGVAIIGRPVARNSDDGRTAEVARLCTDGTENACSFLYGAAARAAFGLGFERIGTYILETETGVSLRAAGWRYVRHTRGGSWSRARRPRVDTCSTARKMYFERSK